MTSPSRTDAKSPDFVAFARDVKAAVDARVAAIAHASVARAERSSSEAGVVLGALFDLATRGGKRVRPVLLSAAHLACGGDSPNVAIAAGAALEVLHAYLLVHDDWMDDDDVRRGGPAAHAALRAHFGARAAGDACAILAGDFGQAIAFELLSELETPADRALSVIKEVSRMLGDVVIGQIIDVRASAVTRDEVEAMHRLKTSSYTTTSPLVIGAILAGADGPTVDALRALGDPLGVAFQLKDDLLGTFGDATRTGKSVRSDLRRGKRTALIAELEEDREAQQLLPRVFGVDDAPDEEVDALVTRLVTSGAKARVEARLAALAADASARARKLAVSQDGKALLGSAIDALSARQQ